MAWQGHGYLIIPVLTDQLVPTSTKPWQELTARGWWCSPTATCANGCGSTACPAVDPSGPSGLARCRMLSLPSSSPGWLPQPRHCRLKQCSEQLPLGPNLGIPGGRGASLAQHSTALQPFGKAALTPPEPWAWCEMTAENHCWLQQTHGHQHRLSPEQRSTFLSRGCCWSWMVLNSPCFTHLTLAQTLAHVPPRPTGTSQGFQHSCPYQAGPARSPLPA